MSRFYYAVRYPLTTNPAKTMTFADLKDAVARLDNDPRVHSTSKVRIEQEHQHAPLEGGIDTWREQEDTVSITIRGHEIVLSSVAAEPALLRP